MKDDKYVKYKVEDVTKPKDGTTVWMDKYWVVSPENEICIFRGESPLCQSILGIAERMCPEGYHVEFIPFVYLYETIHQFIVRLEIQ